MTEQTTNVRRPERQVPRAQRDQQIAEPDVARIVGVRLAVRWARPPRAQYSEDVREPGVTRTVEVDRARRVRRAACHAAATTRICVRKGE